MRKLTQVLNISTISEEMTTGWQVNGILFSTSEHQDFLRLLVLITETDDYQDHTMRRQPHERSVPFNKLLSSQDGLCLRDLQGADEIEMTIRIDLFHKLVSRSGSGNFSMSIEFE